MAQNSYSYQTCEQGSSRPRSYLPEPSNLYSYSETPQYGSAAMHRNYSDDSANSRYTTGSSPNTAMSYSTPSPNYTYETSYTNYLEDPVVEPRYEQELPNRQRSHHQRATPMSLGWKPDTDLWKLYSFVVKKGREPHLELLSEWTATYDTPQRVYLDPPL